MANGKKGDHPLTDLLNHGIRTMPDDICDLVLAIKESDPRAFESSARNYSFAELAKREGDWFAWERGEHLDEARAFLAKKLELARALKTRTDPAADGLKERILAEFPQWSENVRDEADTYPLDHPDPSLAGFRIIHATFVIRLSSDPYRVLVVHTYPEPQIYWDNALLRRYVSGEDDLMIDFLRSVMAGRLEVIEVASDGRVLGAAAAEPGLEAIYRKAGVVLRSFRRHADA